MRAPRILGAAVLLLVLPAAAESRIWHIQADGSGDAATIQAAIDASAGGDIIQAGPGTYYENLRFRQKAITLESTVGAMGTTLDGSFLTAGPDTGSVVVMGSAQPGGSVLRGFTLKGGTGTLISGSRWGGGVLCFNLLAPVQQSRILACVIENNVADLGGGVALDHQTDGEISQTMIRANQARARGAGVWFNQTQSRWRLSFCIINNNIAAQHGGGLDIDMAVSLTPVGPSIENCTLVYNGVPPGGYHGGGIHCSSLSSPTITRTIIALSNAGEGLYCESIGGKTANPQVSCTNIFGNTGGDAFCGTDLGGNFSLDPHFCNAPAGVFSLTSASECRPYNHPTGTCNADLIGARPLGCGDSWCYPTLPDPVLVAQYVEPGGLPNTVTVHVGVTNWPDYPESLFVQCPDLPPCGLNDHASRTYVDVLRGDGSYIYGYCAVSSPTFLDSFAFNLDGSQPLPDSIYVTLWDRRCNIRWASNRIAFRDVSGVPAEPAPPRLVLYQNAPNPLRERTVFQFVLPAEGRARLRLFDVTGREIAVPLDAVLPAGPHDLSWAPAAGDGGRLAVGLYIYRLETAAGVLSRKLVLLP